MFNPGKRYDRKIIMTIATFLVVIYAAACTPRNLATTAQPDATPKPSASSQPGAAPVVWEGQALLVNQSADGKGLELLPIDLSSGKPVEGLTPIRMGWRMSHAFSADRTRLALFYNSDECPRGCLSVINLADFTQMARIEIPLYQGYNDWVSQILFSADNRRLAVISINDSQGTLAYIDLERQKPEPALVGVMDLGINPHLAAFTTSGDAIMFIGGHSEDRTTTGFNPTTRALLVSTSSLEVAWQRDLPEVKDGFFGSGDHSKLEENTQVSAGVVADPGNDRMLIAHADQDKLTIVDFGRQTTRTLSVSPRRTMIERFVTALLSLGARPVQAKVMNSVVRQSVLSADGKTLYVSGMKTEIKRLEGDEYQPEHTPLGLQAWDVEGGVLLARNEQLAANDLRLAPDGSLYLATWDGFNPDGGARLLLVDPQSLKVLAQVANAYAVVAPTLDGALALLSASIRDQRTVRLAVLDMQTLAPKAEWDNAMDPDAYWLSIK